MNHLPFTLFSGIGLFLILLPLPLQWRARNISILLNLAWIFAAGFVFFLNSILWWQRYDIFAPVWCDISEWWANTDDHLLMTGAKIITVYPIGLAASSLCINRRLAAIASSRSVLQDRVTTQRNAMIDLALGIALPLIYMCIAYIFQPHRFDILENVGCEPLIWPCLGSILLFYLCPVILNIVSAAHGGETDAGREVNHTAYAIRYFFLRRSQVKSLLKSSKGGLGLSHYFRLIGMATCDIVLGLPLSIYYMYGAITSIREWGSWEDVHHNFSRIVARSEESISGNSTFVTQRFMPRWLCPLMCAIFFLFFGVGEDAIKEYARWVRPISSLCFHHKTVIK